MMNNPVMPLCSNTMDQESQHITERILVQPTMKLTCQSAESSVEVRLNLFVSFLWETTRVQQEPNRQMESLGLPETSTIVYRLEVSSNSAKLTIAVLQTSHWSLTAYICACGSLVTPKLSSHHTV